MTARRRLAASLALALAAWAAFSWPLPRHAASGIPCGARNVEHPPARRMIPGDHLQLLYHFWLAGDMLAGGTPLFHNRYEFNTGDDAARLEPGPYYVPFSLVYAAVAAATGSRALGWNAAGIASLWLAALATWALARRYARRETAGALAAAVGLALPCRWVTLLGGSPTGFAVAFVPLLLLGLDIGVRDERPAGGALAAAALLFAFTSDLHTFFFSALLIPAWCLFAFLRRLPFPWRSAGAWRRLAGALLPVILAAAAFLALRGALARGLAAETVREGWSLRETALFAPRWTGLFAWRGGDAQMYAGWALPALVLAGGLRLAVRFARDRRGGAAPLAAWLLLALGLAGVVALALGPHGPFGGAPFVLARRLVPSYRMVRQAAKILCLAPALAGLAAAVSFDALAGPGRATRGRMATLLAAALAIVAECRAQVSATVCLLDRGQQAYAAAAAETPGPGGPARALALPIWPGNSHWTSPNQYYASLYRLRLLNGYRPGIDRAYLRDVFLRLESLNQGAATDAQLDDLLRRGCRHILLHEDAFPTQVSPFPAGWTLRRLLNHPRLRLVAQDERVWTFRILEAPEPRPEVAAGWTWLFPTLRWEAERGADRSVRVEADPAAGGGVFARLEAGGGGVSVSTRAPVCRAPDLRWWWRVRGPGRLDATLSVDGAEAGRREFAVDAAEWTWLRIPLDAAPESFLPALSLRAAGGTVDLDLCLLAAGPWEPLAAGESRRIPAPCFVHAGYTDLGTDSVILAPESDPGPNALQGPGLPLDPGAYRVEFAFESPAADGTVLGQLAAAGGGIGPWALGVVAGRPCVGEFTQRENLPLELSFAFARRGEIRIRAVTLTRLR